MGQDASDWLARQMRSIAEPGPPAVTTTAAVPPATAPAGGSAAGGDGSRPAGDSAAGGGGGGPAGATVAGDFAPNIALTIQGMDRSQVAAEVTRQLRELMDRYDSDQRSAMHDH